MKSLLTLASMTVLLGLAGCNEAGTENNSAENATEANAVDAATANATDEAATNSTDGKPAAEAAATDGNVAVDKPAANETAPAEGEAGEKPTN